MQRAHKIRMYPTREQEVLLRKTAGTARYAYNWALAEWKEMYRKVKEEGSTERPSAVKLSARWTRERPEWANETFRGSQTRAILNVGTAFTNMWAGRAEYPQFHKKGRRDSFYVDNAHARLDGKAVFLPRIGKVRLAEKLRFQGKIMSYTVTHYAGQWHVSVQVETPDDVRPACAASGSVVGVDAGLRHIAVASDGSVLDTPTGLERLDTHLKDTQRKLSRSQKGSSNRAKLLLRKQKIQNRINNIRQDAVHKFTNGLAKNHGTVVTETLDIQEMKSKASKGLRCCLQSSMMSELIRQLSYKAQRHVKVDRFFPSSKRCSCCGNVKDSLALSERVYRCDVCGSVLDRDMNAALNLMQAGAVGPGVPVEASPRG